VTRRPRQLVIVKLVPFGQGKWGVAATLDGGRSYINYVVGDKAEAEAEAQRLKRTAPAIKPDTSDR
jgi:hypothetical protein